MSLLADHLTVLVHKNMEEQVVLSGFMAKGLLAYVAKYVDVLVRFCDFNEVEVLLDFAKCRQGQFGLFGIEHEKEPIQVQVVRDKLNH